MDNVSIIVIARNAASTLPNCLTSLFALNFPKNQLEIIVVDNHSKDRTAEIAKSYPVTYCFEPKVGRPQARNHGLRMASGDLIGFVDADCVVDPEWLNYLQSELDDPKIMAAGGNIRAQKSSSWVEAFFADHPHFRPLSNFSDEVLLPSLRTSNLLIRRSAFALANEFDSVFFTNEDIDFCYRLQLRGGRLAYQEKAIVHHRYPANLKKLLSKAYEAGHFTFLLIKKYNPFYDLSGWATWKYHLAFHFPEREKDRKRDLFLWLLAKCLFDFSFTAGWISGLLRPIKINLPDIKLQTEIIIRKNNGEIVISHLSRRKTFALGTLGSSIFKYLEENKSLAEISVIIKDEYETTMEEASTDVQHFHEMLIQEDIFSLKQGKHLHA